jgi:hypothetical protein
MVDKTIEKEKVVLVNINMRHLVEPVTACDMTVYILVVESLHTHSSIKGMSGAQSSRLIKRNQIYNCFTFIQVLQDRAKPKVITLDYKMENNSNDIKCVFLKKDTDRSIPVQMPSHPGLRALNREHIGHETSSRKTRCISLLNANAFKNECRWMPSFCADGCPRF